jgi:hypothetical protein
LLGHPVPKIFGNWSANLPILNVEKGKERYPSHVETAPLYKACEKVTTRKKKTELSPVLSAFNPCSQHQLVTGSII